MIRAILGGMIFGGALAWADILFPSAEFWVLMLIFATANVRLMKGTDAKTGN